jgi:predicted RNA methylase
MVRSRRELAVFLSKLKVFEKPHIQLEQYSTDSDVAAQLLWQAHLNNELENCSIIDLGCGTGILGIGALLLGAKKITFIDIDATVLKTLKENLEFTYDHWEIEDFDNRWEFINSDASRIKTEELQADIVITNPPFGTKTKHADKLFLEVATKIAPITYSMHKTSTKSFLTSFASSNNIQIIWQEDIKYPLKPTMGIHRKRLERIDVTLICFQR